tara:strand:+ start:3329 stop:4012 length:684 start_codon:yes stop_codon:yes gene_type:complete
MLGKNYKQGVVELQKYYKEVIKKMIKLQFFVLSFSLFLLTSCSNFQKALPQLPEISVSIRDQDRIRFSGKGAGAGMMMSSSMGAMGIAIGVAIDEGIGKDIHSTFVADGGDFASLAHSETGKWLSEICQQEMKSQDLCTPSSQLNINIYRYGFVTTSGENDPVKPELAISFSLNQNPEIRLNLKDVDLSSVQIPLADVKADGEKVFNSLRLGYQTILKQYENSFSAK